MSNMNIGIDIDDTISSTFEKTYPRAKKYAKNVLGRDTTQIDYSNAIDYDYIEKMLKLSTEEMEDFWRKNLSDLIQKVQPKKAAAQIINKLKSEGHKIIIITARWNEDYCDSEKLSKEWLDKYQIAYDKLYIGAKSKKQIAIDEKLDIFIDDSIRNCREVSSANIKCLLFASKINVNNKQSKDFDMVHSWNEIYERINKEEI